jgi:hypothetical protein
MSEHAEGGGADRADAADGSTLGCPVGALFLGLQSAASPDAVEHLLNAASELVAAARAALDAADAVIESQREAHARRAAGGSSSRGAVQRISVVDP